jgi:hypothetical protein
MPRNRFSFAFMDLQDTHGHSVPEDLGLDYIFN